MERIIRDLLNGKMNWRKRILWAVAAALLAPFGVVLWFFAYFIITHEREIAAWLFR